MRFNVGALARETATPVATLRTWALRYDFPKSERSEGGHRLYDERAVEMVELAKMALAAGHRPATVMRASVNELRALVGRVVQTRTDPTRGEGAAGADGLAPEGEEHAGDGGKTAALIGAAAAFDASELRRLLRTALAERGLEAFVLDVVPSFLQELGDRWSDGRIDVAHEHFASGVVEVALAETWMGMRELRSRGTVVLACLPEEQHGLGLHLVASLLALDGFGILLLGPNTPPLEIGRAATASRAVLVAVSVVNSPATALVQVRAALPPECKLIYGGRRAPTHVEGAVRLSLGEVRDWAKAALPS